MSGVNYHSIAATLMSRQGTADLARNRELVSVVAEIIETGAASAKLPQKDVVALIDMKIVEQVGGKFAIHQKWHATIESAIGKMTKRTKKGASSTKRVPQRQRSGRISVGA